MTDPHIHDQHTMATNLTNIPVDEIRALVDERARYEGWIGALESRRGQTPPHVYDRVRGDYDGRLGKVMERLGTFVSALREGESSLARREDELHRSVGERHDELSEIELRTMVGEYPADEGERLRAEKQGEVQGLESDRAGVQEELATLRDLLGRSLPPGEQPPAPARTPTPAASEPAVAQPAALAGAGAGAAAGIDALGGADEPWPAGGAIDRDLATGAPSIETAAPEIARPEYEEWTEETPATAAAAGAGAAAASVADPRTQGGAAPPTTYPAAGMPDQEKTLRCPDCGAMNYPTEWYCEKCGGELAAL